jgi:hypothetical protein
VQYFSLRNDLNDERLDKKLGGATLQIEFQRQTIQIMFIDKLKNFKKHLINDNFAEISRKEHFIVKRTF